LSEQKHNSRFEDKNLKAFWA